MGRTNRTEKRDHKEGRVIIIERSGLVKFKSSANHRLHKRTDSAKPQKQRKPKLVFV